MRSSSPRAVTLHRPGKASSWLLAGAVFFAVLVVGCCGVFGFIGWQGSKARQEALAEADRLYPKSPAQAVAKYKEGYGAAGSRKAEVIQRIVDHEAAAGNADEARKWVERGLDDGVTVEYTSPAAKDLYAKVQRDRAEKGATRKAEREAKDKKRADDRAGADRIKANKNLTRDRLRSLVSGLTPEQVIAELGKPDETQDVEGLGQYWYYHNAGVDPVTGRKTAQVQLVFENGVVTSVNFN